MIRSPNSINESVDHFGTMVASVVEKITILITKTAKYTGKSGSRIGDQIILSEDDIFGSTHFCHPNAHVVAQMHLVCTLPASVVFQSFYI